MLLSWIGLVGLAAMSFITIGYGAGVDAWNIPKTSLQAYAKVALSVISSDTCLWRSVLEQRPDRC